MKGVGVGVATQIHVNKGLYTVGRVDILLPNKTWVKALPTSYTSLFKRRCTAFTAVFILLDSWAGNFIFQKKLDLAKFHEMKTL